jgi:hypothetical protein
MACLVILAVALPIPGTSVFGCALRFFVHGQMEDVEGFISKYSDFLIISRAVGRDRVEGSAFQRPFT